MRPGRLLSTALWLLFVIASSAVVSRSTFTADLSAFLPDTPTPEQRFLVDQLRHGALSRLILIGIGGADASTRAALDKSLAQQLKAMPEFASINNGEALNLARDQQFLFSNRYLLSPAITPARFTKDGLRAALGDTLDELASSAGLLIKPLLSRDPTGEMMQMLEQFNHRAPPGSADGVWVSKDGTRALLLAQTAAAVSDTDAQQRAVAAVQQAFRHAQTALAAPPNPPAQLMMTGPGVFSVSARDTIRHEVVRLSLISTAIIVTLLLVVYRSWLALALGMLPVATGVLAGIAAVSLGYGAVHGITLGFGITLIGEAVDYSIYFFMQSERASGDGTDAAAHWISSFWPTIRLGAMISVIGFACLLLASFPGLAQLGLYSTAGLIAAAAVTRFVLPALSPRHLRIRDVSNFGAVLLGLARRAPRLRWTVVVLVLAAAALLYGQRHVLWNQELSALSPIAPTEQALDTALRSDLGAPDPRYLVVVSADSLESALNAADHIAQRLEPLVTAGVIAAYDSPSRYLPSVAMQRARQNTLPADAELAARLREATATLPLRAERLTPFLADVRAARQRAPLQRADLAGTSLALGVDAMLLHEDGHWNALLPLQAPLSGHAATQIDPALIRTALAATDGSHAVFVDVKAELERIYAGYLREVIRLSLFGLAAILGLLIFSLHSPRRILGIMAPLLGAVVVVSAGLVVSGQQLTLLHLIGMLLIVAVGSNYALFFDRGATEVNDRYYARTLASLLFANMTTVVVFGLLAFSKVPVLKAIGSTVAPGVVLALLFAAVLTTRHTTMQRGVA